MKRLYKSSTNQKFMGVCGGLGDYFGIDPVIIRFVFLMLQMVYSIGIFIYLALAFALPYDYEVEREQPKRRQPFERKFRGHPYHWGGHEEAGKRKDVTPKKTVNKDDWSDF